MFAADGGAALVPALASAAGIPVTARPVPAAAPITGFAHEGGSLAQVLALLGETIPLVADADGAGLAIGPATDAGPVALPGLVASAEGEFGIRTGARRGRRGDEAGPSALRYYDSGRDYQPGFQRAVGRAHAEGERVLELPATLSAEGAGALIDAVRLRAATAGERMQLRVAALAPALAPGVAVSVPGEGIWRVQAWEWRSSGIELDLRREPDLIATQTAADPGTSWHPVDRLPATTILEAFELPWDGSGAPDAVRIHAALGAGAGRWAGAALYVERAGALEPLTAAGPARAVTARLTAALAGSPALMFEPAATIDILCDDPAAEFAAVDGAALAAGANRLLVGEEIVQFMRADPLGAGRWRLAGLLRGRGATEAEARAGHLAGARAVLLDDRLHLLDGAAFDPATERLAAIGIADDEPVFAAVRAPGRSRRPLAPVHPLVLTGSGDGMMLAWTRRARGVWAWRDYVDAPLVEERERYEVGAGAVDAPLATWPVDGPSFTLAGEALAALPTGTALWVRQIGSHARSPALLLHILT